MQEMPHRYTVVAHSHLDEVRLQGENLPDIATAAPAEFGGPGDKWSPETLLTGAVANCFILSFKAIARASKFEWDELSCEVTGVLDRVARKTMFTGLHLKTSLTISDRDMVEKAERLLEKAEASCLITNSLVADATLEVEIVVI